MTYFAKESSGQKEVETISLFPGMDLSFHRLKGSRLSVRHKALASVWEVHFCRKGRIGWKMGKGGSVYLGEGELCVHGMDCCTDSEILLPSGSCEGAAFRLDFQKLKEEDLSGFVPNSFCSEEILKKLQGQEGPLVFSEGCILKTAFDGLWDMRKEAKVWYYKLKGIELLLLLWNFNPGIGRKHAQYVPGQTEQLARIHQFLMENLARRYTIEELSKMYLMNTSSLKESFKAMYGLPVAAYMKQQRIKRAKRLLRSTDDAVADIAKKVGYETQGKFAKAFKEIVGMSPTEYRKKQRSELQ